MQSIMGIQITNDEICARYYASYSTSSFTFFSSPFLDQSGFFCKTKEIRYNNHVYLVTKSQKTYCYFIIYSILTEQYELVKCGHTSLSSSSRVNSFFFTTFSWFLKLNSAAFFWSLANLFSYLETFFNVGFTLKAKLTNRVYAFMGPIVAIICIHFQQVLTIFLLSR